MAVGIVVLVMLGVIVAATPSAVVTNLAFLLSERGLRKSLAFLLGWEIALVLLTLAGAGIAVALTVVAESRKDVLDGGVMQMVGIAELVVGGIMLVVAAVTYFKGRSQMERLMDRTLKEVDRIGWLTAFGLGAFGASLNLPWMLAASAEVSRTGRTLIEQGVMLLVFFCVSSVTIAVPALIPAIWPQNSGPWLAAARSWLVRNGSTVAAAATAVVALVILVRGGQALGWLPAK